MAKSKFTVIDVSYYQGKIDWKKVKKSGIGGAIIRVSDSINNMDSRCDRNIAQCEKYGIPFGLYIYSRARIRRRQRKKQTLF